MNNYDRPFLMFLHAYKLKTGGHRPHLAGHAFDFFAGDGCDAFVRTMQRRIHRPCRAVALVDDDRAESEVIIGGDLATERLAFTMILEPAAGGTPMILTGKGVHVYRRQADGDWKLSVDIWNADNPPAS